eukprot:CAMPEP_0172574840 /NCGR_PEP_ID=MMETSP1067-20121228/136906_1 /TAXON_ID=265564 ORGANISM="Thalassiosira punctigera, Strain Tpunct2005C2" /NCGR_SAMPLE_ID=MMETSP1067 /ASSEMBLY_ACC=CAM_ASM_000444 /LENGTH=602 /DNA_ID=CAMNT_0013367475 /DNA_START=183 /DNA_END=1991 /DNA_ORIENTATION=-
MCPQRRGRRPTTMTRPTSDLRCLYVAAISTKFIYTAVALSLNPTNRYIKEMGKLLRDQQLQVVASPTKTSEDQEVDARFEGDIVDWPDEPYSSYQMLDDPASDAFDGPDSTLRAGRKRFETPRPPSVPYYYQRQRELIDRYYAQLTEEEFATRQELELTQNGRESSQTPVELYGQPQRDTGELLKGLNGHIGNFDQPISDSLRSVVDDTSPQPESEWGYDVQNGYFNVDDGYSSPQYDSVEANGSTYYFEVTESDDATRQQQSEQENQVLRQSTYYFEVTESDDATRQQQSEQENQVLRQELERLATEKRAADGSTYYFEVMESDDATPQQQSEQENQVLRQELERLATEKKAAEESAERAEQELRERERLEQERLEKQRIAAERAEADRVERLREEKEELERELARQRAAEERRISESRQREPTFIVKSKLMPKLPDTNDPFELLGLDYRDPPTDAQDLRRAFLKMAKKYHPDAVAKDATQDERENASLCFARINSAYQLLKDKQERLGDEYFATMLGGPMYDSRSSHIRRPFSRGYGFDEYGSIFSGNSYSATYGAKRSTGGQQQRGSHNWDSRNPFRRKRQEVGDNCHVGGEFPPFFNH